MPWTEVRPMDQKLLFLADYLRGGYSFTALCALYGISRKTGYKWVKRYQQHGLEGLDERSRQPLNQPLKTPHALRKALLSLRHHKGAVLGAKKIQALLAQRYADTPTPSRTTIYNILNSEGLIQKRRRKRRVPPFPQPFKPVSAPNELWSVDFKGQFKLGNGRYCYPLTVMDHDSRYLLCCDGLHSTRHSEARHSFERLFKDYGLPERIRSDNGVPFATRAAGGLSRLAVWWIRLGICPERIEPGQPQQNGRHERMHRTLKQATTKPPQRSLKQQQQAFERFRTSYNEERPHEALAQRPPVTRYCASPRTFPARLPELHYPDYYELRKVRRSGVVYWHNGQVYISHLLEDEYIGLNEIDDGIWEVYFGPMRLGTLDERATRGSSSFYLTLKV